MSQKKQVFNPPKTETEFNDLVRRQVIHELSNKSVKELSRLLTYEYSIHIPYLPNEDTRNLVTLSTKKKGKWRVYTDQLSTPKPTDIYISYLSKKDIKKLTSSIGDPSKATPLIDAFGDRWCVTLGKPAREFKGLMSLMKKIVLIEVLSNKDNRPPEGSNPNVWDFGPYYPRLIPKINNAPVKIVCTLKRLR